MRLKKVLIIIILLFVMLSGCKNDDFTPLRNFENNYVVYCVLDNRSDKQFVEIQRAFYPGMNKKLPGTTTVTVTEMPNSVYILKDTNIAGREDYNVFYIDKLNLKRGSNYRLDVKNDLFSAQYSEITLPQKHYLTLRIVESNDSPPNYDFQFKFMNGTPSVYVYHFYIEYEALGKVDKIEVFLDYVTYPIYPSFITSGQSSSLFYRSAFVESVLLEIKNIVKVENTEIKIKKGYLVYHSLEPNLYNYYLAERGYNDSYSIRLDKPYWTNMKTKDGAGLGLFGAECADTLFFKIPFEMIKRDGLIDDQNF
jgi:hypothetical protein